MIVAARGSSWGLRSSVHQCEVQGVTYKVLSTSNEDDARSKTSNAGSESVHVSFHHHKGTHFTNFSLPAPNTNLGKRSIRSRWSCFFMVQIAQLPAERPTVRSARSPKKLAVELTAFSATRWRRHDWDHGGSSVTPAMMLLRPAPISGLVKILVRMCVLTGVVD